MVAWRWLVGLLAVASAGVESVDAGSAVKKGKGKAGKAKATPAPTQQPPTLVDGTKHYTLPVTAKNFGGILAAKQRKPLALLFYGDQKSEGSRQPPAQVTEYFTDVFEPLAKELHGFAKLGAVDCGLHPSLCKSENVDPTAQSTEESASSPSPPAPYKIKIYLPDFRFIYEKATDMKSLKKELMKFIPKAKLSQPKTEQEVKNFLNHNPTVPKVLLFTEKAKVSPLYNTLANEFSDRMDFAFLSVPEAAGPTAEIAKKFGFLTPKKKLPQLLMKQGNADLVARGAQIFDKQFSYGDLHEWLNVRAETFVRGGGFSDKEQPTQEELARLKPWLFARVPEMTKASHKEICFSKKFGFCATYLKDGEITEEDLTLIETLSKEFHPSSKPAYHWAWLNLKEEPNFATDFKVTGEGNGFVIIKRNGRFAAMDVARPVNHDSIVAHLEKIANGEGHFTPFAGRKLPQFAARSLAAKSAAGEKKDEL